MSLPQELIQQEIGKAVWNILDDSAIFDIVSTVIQHTAVQILEKIQAVLSDPDLDDFQYIEEIVEIFSRYGISTNCHDF